MKILDKIRDYFINTHRVTFDHEYAYAFQSQDHLTGEEKEEMIALVCSDKFKVLQKCLHLHALQFWRSARGTKDANVTVVLNQIGSEFEKYAQELHSLYGAKPKQGQVTDPYAV